MHISSLISIVLGLLLSSNVKALDNGLALKPPMGWLTWERFRCVIDCDNFPADCIGERLIKETADRLVEDGWLKVGYEYITVDDCWMSKQRAADGQLVADTKRFPNGMKSVADYVHSKGLKFGIYADFGTLTCGGYPGTEFHLQQDANTFAAWGVDLVKLDGCYSDVTQQVEGYEIFGFYLNKTGRPMVYSCSWPAYQSDKPSIDSASLLRTCNMWRIFGDIQDSWDSVLGIINAYKKNPYGFQKWAGPGHWNDPDMVILGNFGLSHDQERVQMAMWSMFAAPLILSVDLRKIYNMSRDLLMNPRLLALNQDKAGKQAEFVKEEKDIQIWKRELSTGAVAVAFINTNTGGTPTLYQFTFASILHQYNLRNRMYNVSDVISGQSMGKVDASKPIPVVVNPTGVMLLSFI